MRFLGVLGLIVLAGISLGQNLSGVWKASVRATKVAPSQAKSVAVAQKVAAKASLKLNKDRTFGCFLQGRVMTGSWTLAGGVVTLNVKEVVGMSAKQVAAMSPSDRIAKLRIEGKALVMAAPKPGAPVLVWKRAPGS